MSTMMVYALKGAIGGAVENVWGYDMQVSRIDSSDKAATDAAKANGYTDKAQDIIELIKAKAMQKDNDRMKGQLSSGADKKRIKELEDIVAKNREVFKDANGFIDEKNERIKELEVELAGALIESAKLESELKHTQDKLAIYELAKDKNGDGEISYDELDKAELQKLLDKRGVKYVSRDGVKELIHKLKDSE